MFAPLGDSESCMPGPKASAQGADMMWGWPHRGRRGVMLGGEGFFFSRSLRRDRHTFFLASHKPKLTVSLAAIPSFFFLKRGKKKPPIPSFLNIPENLQSINLLKPLI